MTNQVADTEEPPFSYVLSLTDTATFPIGQYQVRFRWTQAGVTREEGRRRMGIYASVPSPLVTDENLPAIIYDLNDFIGDRADWTQTIAASWGLMLTDIARIRRPDGVDLDPFEVADSSELYDLHLWQAIELVALELRSSDADRFGLLHAEAKEKYAEARASFAESQLARWGSGPVATNEVRERSQMRSHVKHYGIDNSAAADRVNDSNPPVTMATKW